jgi:hypothetical protein
MLSFVSEFLSALVRHVNRSTASHVAIISAAPSVEQDAERANPAAPRLTICLLLLLLPNLLLLLLLSSVENPLLVILSLPSNVQQL